MRRLITAVLAAGVVLVPGTAWADHEWRGGGYEADEDCRNGGCGEREEQYGDNSCKYVCPDFKDSPVHDAFNFAPQVCLPGATCYWDREPDESGQGEARPQSGQRNPTCLVPVPFHCDPAPE